MKLSIIISNDIQHLAQDMIKTLDAQKGQVFHPHYIVTQTAGMNQWIRIQMAQQLGIAANLNMVKPAEILWNIYKILDGKRNEKINKQDLDWIIHAILNDPFFIQRFPKQANYYINEGVLDEMKRWEFAVKIADLFDQYQIYRSSLIQHWNQENWELTEHEQQWQAYIWQAIKIKTENAVLDFSEIQQYIISALKQPDLVAKLQAKMPILHLFGLSVITPFHLHIFYAVSEHIPVHWYISNPAPNYYWFEDEAEKQIFLKRMKGKDVAHISVGNSLLTSWGKILQNTFRLFFKNEEFINAIKDLENRVPSRDTLLHCIQNDLSENALTPSIIDAAMLNDKSITICNNYSKKREVETVYNYLLNTVLNQTFGTVTERDIVVMVNDINAYAPFIRAVMDNAPHSFSYTIADESISNGDTLITALIAILECNAKFHVESVLALLNAQFIRKKFGIVNTDLIREVITKANIKFGSENDYQDPQDDTYLVSWKYGLEKIMFGLCMTPENTWETNHKLYPLETVDNENDRKQIVGFVALVERLIAHVAQRAKARTIADWQSFITQTLQNFIATESQEEQEQEATILRQFEQTATIALHLKNEFISYEVFSKRLIEGLNNEQNKKLFTRGITFCSPLPFRSLPFKIVAILGLNHDNFPRQEQALDFDLMSKKPQLGDRNIKNNDKHLFLESILSAKDALYLSYIGKSTKDNKALPPSTLIDELIEYIQEAIPHANVKEALVQEHPLHSYSVKYNQENSPILPNFLIKSDVNWPLPEKNGNIIEDSSNGAIPINKVWKFLKTPIKYYYNEVLGIYIQEAQHEIEPNEVFTLDSLEKWQLKKDLFDASLNNELTLIQEKDYLNGNLPLRQVAEGYITEAKTFIEPILNSIETDFGSNKTSKHLQIELHHQNQLFQGQVENIIADTVVLYSYSKPDRSHKYKAETIFKYLLAKTQDNDIDGAVLYTASETFRYRLNSQEEAQTHLRMILDTYLKLRQKPVLYSISNYQSGKKKEEIKTQLKKSSIPSEFSFPDKYEVHAGKTPDILALLDDHFEEMQQLINTVFKAAYAK